MPFKREENFKMDLSKCLKFLNIKHAPEEKDIQRKDPQKWLAQRQLRTHVLLNQDNKRTEAIHTFCDGKNMLATFERIRREIEDLHLAYVGGKFDPYFVPVMEYSESSSSATGKLGRIHFKTQRGQEIRTIKLSIKEAPGSAVSRNAPRNMSIKFGVDCKVNESKLRTLIHRLVVSGDLFIDFITEIFWKFLDEQEEAAEKLKAQLEKAEKVREEIAAKQQEGPVEKERPKGLGGMVDKKHKEFGGDGYQKSHSSSFHSNRSFAGTDSRRPFGSSNNNNNNNNNNSFPSSFRQKDHRDGRGPNAIPRVGQRDQRDRRDHRDFRENRDHRGGENREFGERRNSREPRDNRDHHNQFRNRDNNQRVSTHRGMPENSQLLGIGSSSAFQNSNVQGKPPPLMGRFGPGTRGGAFGGGMKRGQGRGGANSKQWRGDSEVPKEAGVAGESGTSTPGKE